MAEMENLRIILVDDNLKFRESVKDLLTQVYNHNIIAEAGNGIEFLALPKSLRPDLIFMDLSMPKMDGFEATREYYWEFPKSRIIAITNHIEKAYLLKLIEAGFKGCIFKYNVFSEISPAIEKVMNNQLWFPGDYAIGKNL